MRQLDTRPSASRREPNQFLCHLQFSGADSTLGAFALPYPIRIIGLTGGCRCGDMTTVCHDGPDVDTIVFPTACRRAQWQDCARRQAEGRLSEGRHQDVSQRRWRRTARYHPLRQRLLVRCMVMQVRGRWISAWYHMRARISCPLAHDFDRHLHTTVTSTPRLLKELNHLFAKIRRSLPRHPGPRATISIRGACACSHRSRPRAADLGRQSTLRCTGIWHGSSAKRTGRSSTPTRPRTWAPTSTTIDATCWCGLVCHVPNPGLDPVLDRLDPWPITASNLIRLYRSPQALMGVSRHEAVPHINVRRCDGAGKCLRSCHYS